MRIRDLNKTQIPNPQSPIPNPQLKKKKKIII